MRAPVVRLMMWFALALALIEALPALAQARGDTLIVSPDGMYPTIEAALAAAHDGDVIEVHSGVYPAPLSIDKSVSLIGVDQPVIDGQGKGSLVLINAPGVLFQGFVLRNTGSVQEREDCALVIQAPRVTVADNLLENVLFGIYFAQADDGVARGNVIRSMDTMDMGMRGDAIRIWYSSNVHLVGNDLSLGRDTLIWYANDVIIEQNRFHKSRYGLHFMYSKGGLVQDNVFEDNHIGMYYMYSDNLTLLRNTIAHNRGPSGYGIALKEMDNITAIDNAIVGNRIGLYIDNSPLSYEVYNHFTDNMFAYNDIGVTGLPSAQNNIFTGNGFIENIQQASTEGRGTLQRNIWTQDGVGNYWSDYAGYDGDGDGFGDLPYRAEKLFESLADEHDALRLFAFSPATQAIDFAAAAFPSLRPDPKLIDEAPLMRYALPSAITAGTAQDTVPQLGAALLLVSMGGSVCLFALRFARPAHQRRRAPKFGYNGRAEARPYG